MNTRKLRVKLNDLNLKLQNFTKLPNIVDNADAAEYNLYACNCTTRPFTIFFMLNDNNWVHEVHSFQILLNMH